MTVDYSGMVEDLKDDLKKAIDKNKRSEEQANKTSELKRCPFCGGEAKIYGYYFIQCTKCGSSTLTHTNRESAINTWNTRFPTVKAKPVVHGEWLEVNGCLSWFYQCSVCDEYNEYKTNFCKHCGADMQGGSNEQSL